MKLCWFTVLKDPPNIPQKSEINPPNVATLEGKTNLL